MIYIIITPNLIDQKSSCYSWSCVKTSSKLASSTTLSAYLPTKLGQKKWSRLHVISRRTLYGATLQAQLFPQCTYTTHAAHAASARPLSSIDLVRPSNPSIKSDL